MNRNRVAHSVLLAGICVSLVGCGAPPAMPNVGNGDSPDTGTSAKYYKLAQTPDTVLSTGSPTSDRSRFIWEELLEDVSLLSAGERVIVTDDPFVANPANIDGEPISDVIEDEFNVTADENPFKASTKRGDPFYYWEPELSGWVFVFPAEDALDAIPGDLRATIINALGEPFSEEAYDGCRSNAAPLANAGVDKEVDLQTRVTLSGLSSSDVDGDSLSYRWEQVSGEAVVLDRAVTSSPSFLPPDEGIFEFAVTASDSCGLTDVDTVRISVGGTVQAGCPTARARTDQSVVSEGAVANLDGGNSVDTEGFPLGYSWRQSGGPPVDLIAPSTAIPSFTAPRVVGNVELTFELTVTNGSCSDMDTLTITVLNTDLNAVAPVANAGASQNVDEGTTVTLDGSFSADPGSLELAYSWSQSAGPTVVLSDSTASRPTFVAPQVNEDTTLTFSLLVSNGTDTDTGSVTILVRGLADALTITASATPNSAAVGDTVALSGSASGGQLPFAFSWAQVSGPATEMLIGTAAVTPAPTASITLNGAGTVSYSLAVTDANGDTATTEVSVTVAAAGQVVAPLFDPPGGSFTGSVSVSMSTSTAGASIRYTTDGSVPTLSNGAVYSTAPTLTATTTIKAIATKTGMTDSTVPLATFTVTNAVVANAGPDISVNLDDNPVGVNATLSASAAGGDGQYTYSWSPAACLNSSSISSPDVTVCGTAPFSPGQTTFTYTVTVTDGSGNSDTDTVTITTFRSPVANAGSDQAVNLDANPVGVNTTLNGSATGGAGNYTYSWSPSACLNNPNIASPDVTVCGTAPFTPGQTTFTYTLTVTDANGSRDTDAVTLTTYRALAANAGSDSSLVSGGTVALNGSATNGNGSYSYSWSPSAGLSSTTVANPTFTASSVGAFTFTLTVTDLSGNTDTDSVIVTVATPVASRTITDNGNGTWQVAISLSHPQGTSSFLVQDFPPTGWTTSNVSSPGGWSSGSQSVNWTVFSSIGSFTQLTYTVTPGGAGGSFSGTYTSNLVSQTVAGAIAPPS